MYMRLPALALQGPRGSGTWPWGTLNSLLRGEFSLRPSLINWGHSLCLSIWWNWLRKVPFSPSWSHKFKPSALYSPVFSPSGKSRRFSTQKHQYGCLWVETPKKLPWAAADSAPQKWMLAPPCPFAWVRLLSQEVLASPCAFILGFFSSMSHEMPLCIWTQPLLWGSGIWKTETMQDCLVSQWKKSPELAHEAGFVY